MPSGGFHPLCRARSTSPARRPMRTRLALTARNSSMNRTSSNSRLCSERKRNRERASPQPGRGLQFHKREASTTYWLGRAQALRGRPRHRVGRIGPRTSPAMQADFPVYQVRTRARSWTGMSLTLMAGGAGSIQSGIRAVEVKPAGEDINIPGARLREGCQGRYDAP